MNTDYKDQKISDWIIEQNNQFILFSKPSGMPVQKDLTPERDLLTIAQSYAKSTLFLVNRVDRPASGLVLMAKSANATTILSKGLSDPKTRKEYLAIVEGKEFGDSGEITSHMKKGRGNKAIISVEAKEGFKSAVLKWEKKFEFENYTLISIQISTGRFHQIRAQLASAEMHIKGDVKYGARRKNKDRSIGLHAWKMTIKHPISGEVNTYEAPLPKNDVLWSVAAEALPTKLS